MTREQASSPKTRLIASLTIFPIGIGTSLGDYVSKAHAAIKGVPGVEVHPTPMSTVIEAESLDKVFEAVKAGHGAILAAGAQRIHIALTVDDRHDRHHTAQYKVERMLGGPKSK